MVFRLRFLLKYNTRDEVGLLQRGSGGVGEIQGAVNSYEEESPLYGFIHYRRRNVVLKYVPEGTSRLLLGKLGYNCLETGWLMIPNSTTGRTLPINHRKIFSLRCGVHILGSFRANRLCPLIDLLFTHSRITQVSTRFSNEEPRSYLRRCLREWNHP